MAIAAVLFTLPFAFVAALGFAALNGLGLTGTAIVYVTMGGGGMAAFMAAATFAALFDRS